MIDNLYDVIKKLENINVQYMLSGSLAMGFYTISRSTYDIDIVVHLSLSDLNNLEIAFKGDYLYKPAAIEEIKKRGIFNIISNNGGYKIDFILVKSDEYSIQAFNNKVALSDFGDPIFVISLEDLIIAKIRWIQDLYSERQHNDIKNLLVSNKPDLSYIKKWVTQMKLKTYNLLDNE